MATLPESCANSSDYGSRDNGSENEAANVVAIGDEAAAYGMRGKKMAEQPKGEKESAEPKAAGAEHWDTSDYDTIACCVAQSAAAARVDTPIFV